MRRRIVGVVVAGAAGLTLGLLPVTSASAHDGGWGGRSDSRYSDHWYDDDCGGGGNGRWNDHHRNYDDDWGRWDNANWGHGGWYDDGYDGRYYYDDRGGWR
ncbi:hypothetical protein [Streptomyces sp. NPDC048606]|uniref:hypothetical protein n=1 Tax=Streptomyces sp. NPDC048606 TaxID=3154726 RepID=UPI003432C507